MSYGAVERAVLVQGESIFPVLLHTWAQAEQMHAAQSSEVQPVSARPQSGVATRVRRQVEGETPARVRFSFD